MADVNAAFQSHVVTDDDDEESDDESIVSSTGGGFRVGMFKYTVVRHKYSAVSHSLFLSN